MEGDYRFIFLPSFLSKNLVCLILHGGREAAELDLFFLFFLISCMHQGIVPLQSIPTGLQARPQGTDLADNSLG